MDLSSHLPPMDLTDLSCVRYFQGDLVGKLLAHISLLPVACVLHIASLVYCRREVHNCLYFVGLLLNEALARSLKHIIKQPRPTANCGQLDTCDSYGMPSSHTQCMFFATALSLSLLFAQHQRSLRQAKGTHQDRSRSALDVIWSCAEMLALAVCAGAVAYSRIYLGYHSKEQVFVGSGIGVSFGILWALFMLACSPWYSHLANFWPARLLYFKDTWHVAVPLKEERALAMIGAKKKDE